MQMYSVILPTVIASLCATGCSLSAEAPAANGIAAARRPPEWLAAIDRLAQTGEKAAARDELEAFRKAYPEYPVPDKLKKLLAP